MTKKYYDDACDDLINQCCVELAKNGYRTRWSNSDLSIYAERIACDKFSIGYEVFMNYAKEEYDNAYYSEKKKNIVGEEYISTGWRFDIYDFFDKLGISLHRR